MPGWFSSTWEILSHNPVTRRMGYGAAIGAGANLLYGGFYQGRRYTNSAVEGAFWGALGGAAYAGYLGAGSRLIGGKTAASLGEAWEFSKSMQKVFRAAPNAAGKQVGSINAAAKTAMRHASLSIGYIGSELNRAYNAIKVL